MDYRNLISFYTTQVGKVYDESIIPSLRLILAPTTITRQSAMVTAMDDFFAAKDAVYNKRAVILSQLSDTDLLKL